MIVESILFGGAGARPIDVSSLPSVAEESKIGKDMNHVNFIRLGFRRDDSDLSLAVRVWEGNLKDKLSGFKFLPQQKQLLTALSLR